MSELPCRNAILLVLAAFFLTADGNVTRFAFAQVPGRCEIPASQRAEENGCYVSATVAIEETPSAPLFWHIYIYPDRVSAEAVSEKRTTVIDAHGRVWLYGLAEEGWRPSG